jgi:hypothetical protein
MSLLIDVNNVIEQREMLLLKNSLGSTPSTEFDKIGVIVIVGETIVKNLKSKNKGGAKAEYINTPEFVDSIESFCYISFNTKKKRCDIPPPNSIYLLPHILKNTMRYLPNDFTLQCNVDVTDKLLISALVDNGFSGSKISDSCIEMTRINDIDVSNSSSNGETLFTLTNKDRTSCNYKARLSDDAIKYLRGLPERGVTVNDGVFSQKEMAGSLVTGSTTVNMVHHLDIGSRRDEGGVENVGTEPTLVTFHTHPIEAYERNNVSVGWPSQKDYVSFLKVADHVNLIMHIVVAMEGFYVISRNPEWFESMRVFDDKAERVLMNSNAFEKTVTRTGKWHVKEINKTTIDDLHILKVFLIPWTKPDTVVEVFYNKENGSCKIPK